MQEHPAAFSALAFLSVPPACLGIVDLATLREVYGGRYQIEAELTYKSFAHEQRRPVGRDTTMPLIPDCEYALLITAPPSDSSEKGRDVDLS